MDWSAALSDPDALRAQGLFLAEGRLVLERILAGAAGGPDAIVAVLAAPAAVRALRLDERVPGRVTIRAPSEMEALTGFNFHRGALALVRRPPVLDIRAVIESAASMERHARGLRDPIPATRYPVLVVAEHLVDVDNVGSCFRNARAFGAACVLLDDRCPDPLYRKAVRTSLGHVLEVPWAHAPMATILGALREHSVATIGLTPHERQTPNAERRTQDVERTAAPLATLAETRGQLRADEPVALVVGNEGTGLSTETLEACTHLARIAMADGADSLNVATALAVALYELTSRCTECPRSRALE